MNARVHQMRPSYSIHKATTMADYKYPYSASLHLCVILMLLRVCSTSNNIFADLENYGPYVHTKTDDLIGDVREIDLVDGHEVCKLKEESFRPCPCSDESLCSVIRDRPMQEVFAFSVSDKNWRKYDWQTITTVVEYTYRSDELMCLAHKHSAKVVMAAPKFPVEQLTNLTARRQWICGVLQDVSYNFLDGVNLDFEDPIPKSRGDLRIALNILVYELRTNLTFHFIQSQVTFNFGMTANDSGRYYDFRALAHACDFVFIMDYGHGPQHGYAWANSPYLDIYDGFLSYTGLGIAPYKMVMGLPWYGVLYNCTTFNQNNNHCASARTHASPGYGVITEELLPRSYSGRLWDKVARSPFANFKDPSSGQFSQLWYDDPQSLEIKYALAKSLGMKGVGMWHADAIDYSDPDQVSSMWRYA